MFSFAAGLFQSIVVGLEVAGTGSTSPGGRNEGKRRLVRKKCAREGYNAESLRGSWRSVGSWPILAGTKHESRNDRRSNHVSYRERNASRHHR